jgi:hypothetical protein
MGVKTGCCCGIILGLGLVLGALLAAAFWVYCYFFPETWDRVANKINEGWSMFKSSGDELVESVPRSNSGGEPVQTIPEPEVKL